MVLSIWCVPLGIQTPFPKKYAFIFSCHFLTALFVSLSLSFEDFLYIINISHSPPSEIGSLVCLELTSRARKYGQWAVETHLPLSAQCWDSGAGGGSAVPGICLCRLGTKRMLSCFWDKRFTHRVLSQLPLLNFYSGQRVNPLPAPQCLDSWGCVGSQLLSHFFSMFLSSLNAFQLQWCALTKKEKKKENLTRILKILLGIALTSRKIH